MDFLLQEQELHKILSTLAKEGNCEELAEWIRPCENHLYWSATSTHSGNGRVILAKFKSFLSHTVDKHDELDDPLFSKCAHGELTTKKWLLNDSPAYEKLCTAIQNKSLMKGIQQASPFDQTSCLEGLHSVVKQFSPKMIAYSFSGMLCRHILAVIHFNQNLFRAGKMNKKDDSQQIKIVYPKFKNGEATIREVKVNQNFAYVDEIYQTYITASNNTLEDACIQLQQMTPAPMNTMLEKEPREVAIRKKETRKSMVVANVEPTTPLLEVLAREQAAAAAA